MKAPVNGGDLVDFKERIIFEREKDLAIESSEKFYKKLRDKYKYNHDMQRLSALYRKITNYQIKKYGATVSDSDCNYGFATREEKKKSRIRKWARHYSRTHERRNNES